MKANVCIIGCPLAPFSLYSLVCTVSPRAPACLLEPEGNEAEKSAPGVAHPRPPVRRTATWGVGGVGPERMS